MVQNAFAFPSALGAYAAAVRQLQHLECGARAIAELPTPRRGPSSGLVTNSGT